ncbi:MAG: cyclase family protein [Acidobacteriota bacterium]|jgi:kynurenine formamidase
MNRFPQQHLTFATALLTLALAGATACAPAGETAAPQSVDSGNTAMHLFDSDAVQLVDLSYPLSPDSLYWPTGAPFAHELSAGISEGGYWYASGSFSSPEHLGTHLDAPAHFAEHGWSNVDIPLQRLFARGALIDISTKAEADADALLTPDDIAAWEERNGPVPESAVVIVRTGWASRWPDWNDYYGSETPQDVTSLHFPGVSPEAAALLVERGVAGVGLDTASIDYGPSTDFRTHQVLGAANVFNLENLTNIDDLPETGFGIIALPMKIQEGTGGPTRVVAVVPR